MNGMRTAVAASGLAMIATFGVGGFAATAASAAPLHATAASARAAVAEGNDCGPGSLHVPNHYGNADFNPACQHHDVCYGTGSSTARAVCDANLGGEMEIACVGAYGTSGVNYTACHGAVLLYTGTVRTLGRPFYEGTGDPS